MEDILLHIKGSPVIPVFYHDDISYCQNILEVCYSAGIRTFEFVNRGEKALSNFEALRKMTDRDLPGLRLGIGTIKSMDEAARFTNLGADFIVSPIFDSAIADYAVRHEVFWIPGCMTPTEIARAESSGATLIKLFPGDILGPDFLKSVKPLFPDLYFMPTGGVQLDKKNIKAWRDAGVLSIGVGSKLFEGSSPEYPATDKIFSRVKKLLDFMVD